MTVEGMSAAVTFEDAGLVAFTTHLEFMVGWEVLVLWWHIQKRAKLLEDFWVVPAGFVALL